MEKIKVLFVCVHNSARSQMAEAFLQKMGGELFEVESAGFEPNTLNPLAITVMNEVGIDISEKQTNSVFDFYKQGRLYHFVISVCDDANAERCPIFPGITKRLAWSFENPALFDGTIEEKLIKTRNVRDNIKSEVENFIKNYNQVTF